MTTTPLNDFSNQPISILQNNLTTIHGIFSLLRQLNGSYGSRYEINANPEASYSTNSLDKYYEYKGVDGYRSENGKKTITIKFDSPFLLSGYALSNSAHHISGNSYSTGWKMLGVTDDKHILLDEQFSQTFCIEGEGKCHTEKILGFNIKLQYRAFKTFIFEQTSNSYNNDYVYLKSIDLFGTLCGINDQCNYHFFQLTVKTNPHKCNIIILHSFFFCLT